MNRDMNKRRAPLGKNIKNLKPMKNTKSSTALFWIGRLLAWTPIVVIVFFFDEYGELSQGRWWMPPLLFLPMLVGLYLTRLARRPKALDITKSFRSVKRLLFPPAFKWVGFAITAAGLVSMIFIQDKRLWSVAVLGLWIAMWSRDNVEDEMLREVRLSAAWFGLSFVGLYFIFINTMSWGHVSMHVVFFIIMLYYHIVLWSFKRKIRHEKE